MQQVGRRRASIATAVMTISAFRLPSCPPYPVRDARHAEHLIAPAQSNYTRRQRDLLNSHRCTEHRLPKPPGQEWLRPVSPERVRHLCTHPEVIDHATSLSHSLIAMTRTLPPAAIHTAQERPQNDDISPKQAHNSIR